MKTYKRTTESRRHMTTVSYRGVITHTEPHKALTAGRKRDVGRNNLGRITVRHKGAGNKKLFRDVDFMFNKKNIPAKVISVEYDPNRTSFISLVVYADGEKRYMLTSKSVRPGTKFIVSADASLVTPNRLPLSKIPVGTFVYNVELKPEGGAKLVRSAGNFAQVVANDNGYTLVKLPSSEVRKVSEKCWATIGEVSNDEHHLVNIGKAGRSRHLGIRPTVRGTAMNAVDHPYGGGEGRQGRGTKRPKTLWGKVTGGRKTRGPKKYSNHLVVSRRVVGKKRKG